MIFLENTSGSLSWLFLLLLLSLLCPAPLCVQCPSPGLCSCVFPVPGLPHPWQSRELAVLQSLPLSCVLPWSCTGAQSPAVLQCPFQAGAEMGHGATRISAPPRSSMGIEYSSGTGCICGEPKILTCSAGKGNVSSYSVLFSL